jgi:hypothetical protein
VKELIAAYVKTGPLAANNPPPAAGAPAAGATVEQAPVQK